MYAIVTISKKIREQFLNWQQLWPLLVASLKRTNVAGYLTIFLFRMINEFGAFEFERNVL